MCLRDPLVEAAFMWTIIQQGLEVGVLLSHRSSDRFIWRAIWKIKCLKGQFMIYVGPNEVVNAGTFRLL